MSTIEVCYRLPDNIVPLSYNLDIDLDDENFVFSGYCYN